MSQPGPVNWSYIAGYFDGEGCVARTPHSYGLQWTNTHRESLEQMRDFMNVGTIDKGRMGVNLMKYDLRIRRVADLQQVVPILISRCIIKRPALVELLHLVKDKAPTRNRGRLAAALSDDQLCAMYRQGQSCPQLAEAVGVHPMLIQSRLAKLGVTLRTRGEALKLAQEKGRWVRPPNTFASPGEVRRLYWDDGLSARTIAEQFGVSKEGVFALMKRYKIPTRPRTLPVNRRPPETRACSAIRCRQTFVSNNIRRLYCSAACKTYAHKVRLGA